MGVDEPSSGAPTSVAAPPDWASVRTFHADPFAALERDKLIGRCMMSKITHLLLAGAAVFALCDVGVAQETPPQPAAADSAALDSVAATVVAQENLPQPLPSSPEYGVGAGVLETLPRPRDTPRSLFGPAQPPSTGGVDLDGPYFVRDPLLDPPFFPSPGWFAGAEAQIVKPHLINNYRNSVFPGKSINDTTGNFPLGPKATTVDLPAGPLDWTASPRVFRGLPPSRWVRRIHGRLPAPGNHGQLECAGHERAYRSGQPVRLRHARPRLQQPRALPLAPVGHEMDDRVA